MAKAHKASDSEKLAELIIEGIQEKKGKQIQLLDLRDINNAVCDFFIIFRTRLGKCPGPKLHEMS